MWPSARRMRDQMGKAAMVIATGKFRSESLLCQDAG
jgi:hypothetical protein